MSKLFVELYLDEDVDVLIADLLRSREFTVTTTVEAGNRSSEDADQLRAATAMGAAIVTHNRVHFEELAKEWFVAGQSHDGIVIAVRRPAREIARRLLVILDQVTADEMQNQLRYI